MALKADRYEMETLPHFFLNEAATRGGILSVSTGGSGVALDQSVSLATYAAVGSGKKPLGFLLNDMVDIDQTRQHINFAKDEVVKGGKVTILRKGWVVTDQIASGTTPLAGEIAYLSDGARVTNTVSSTGGLIATPKIGGFVSGKDADGYCTVEVNLP